MKTIIYEIANILASAIVIIGILVICAMMGG